jgi:hypothetical protein
MIIILLAVLNHFTIKAIDPSTIWYIEFYDEEEEASYVTLVPGQYTKINVHVSDAENQELTDFSFDKSVLLFTSER